MINGITFSFGLLLIVLLVISGCSTGFFGIMDELRKKSGGRLSVRITGDNWEKGTLSAVTPSAISAEKINFQWKRGNTIIGTNSVRYTVASADRSQEITVTASRAGKIFQ